MSCTNSFTRIARGAETPCRYVSVFPQETRSIRMRAIRDAVRVLNMSELPFATLPEVSRTVMRRSIRACKAASSPSWQERHGGEFGRPIAGAAAPAQLQSRAGNCIVRPNQTGFLGA
jgi:hypothetical protein